MTRMPIPLLVLLSGIPAPAAPPPPRPLVVGHRGARARFPENTLPALRHALSAGADGVEIDVRVSADDVLVLSHDATLSPDRCRADDGRRVPAGLAIRGLSFEALRRFDCGAVADPRFPSQRAVPGTPIPSLKEVLDLLAAPGSSRREEGHSLPRAQVRRGRPGPLPAPGSLRPPRRRPPAGARFRGPDDRPLLRPLPPPRRSRPRPRAPLDAPRRPGRGSRRPGASERRPRGSAPATAASPRPPSRRSTRRA